MKSHPPTRQSGFTLIELLVVISIIAVLAGLAIPTANIVLRKAKETQARAAVQGLVIGVKGYQTEYNRLPNPGKSTTDATIDTDSGNDMISVLLGKNAAYNPREIPFYDPPIAKGAANGLISGAAGGGGGSSYVVVDPWVDSKTKMGSPYHMAFDYDGDRSISNPVKTAASGKFNAAFIAAEPTDLSADVVVYSDGDPHLSSTTRKPITSW